jgi:pyridine nucleotide-disulfide oxidoreductase
MTGVQDRRRELLARTETALAEAVEHWLERLDRALAAADDALLSGLLLPESYWRDLLAFTWEIRTVSGAEAIAGDLQAYAVRAAPRRFALAAGRTPPRRVQRAGTSAIEAIFQFETAVGRGSGVLRLAPASGEGDDLKAWTLLTALDEMKGYEERVGRSRPTGQSYARDFRGPNWLDQRTSAAQFADREPVVLVVGGGQAGLSIAARLNVLQVDTLVIDRWPRIGDNWRQRYHALTLHNQVHVNHLPYMPFPPGWPTYIPKDKLAGWLEAYVESMEINYWPATELVSGTYDEAEGRWSVVLRHADGTTRAMHPRHVVMATGISGIPNLPEIPGLRSFAGTVQHSSRYGDGEMWAGKSAIVVGTGNSGHDIAQDLYSSGAQVTLVQRSPTQIVNIEPSAQLPYALYDEGPPLEDCDLLTAFVPPAAGEEEPPGAHRQSKGARQGAPRRTGAHRLQAGLRRGWHRLAVQIPHPWGRLLLQRRLLRPPRRPQDPARAILRHRRDRRRRCSPRERRCGAGRPHLGLRRRPGAAQHVRPHRPARPVVHRRQPRSVPHLLQAPRPPDQG